MKPMRRAVGPKPAAPWRKSASVIIAAPAKATPDPVRQGLFENVEGGVPGNEADYRICMLKRSGRASFFKDAVVFPGGAMDPCDVALGKELGMPAGAVCAAREAFEEAGAPLFQDAAPEALDWMAWRQKVHKDGEAYRDLLQGNAMSPRRTMELWTQFKTPDFEAAKLKKGGFETEFYATTVRAEDVHLFSCDAKETTLLTWLTPAECLFAFKAGKISLPPPQWMIIKELHDRVARISDLLSYARSPNRALVRDHMIKPCPIVPVDETREESPVAVGAGETDKGRKRGLPVFALPGDELCPEYPTSGGLHRLEWFENDFRLHTNLAPSTTIPLASTSNL